MAQQEMLTANLICMQVQGEWRGWVGGGGAYSVSNLHVKCWPGQLMGMRGIVRPMLFVPTLLQYLSRWLERYKNRHYLNDSQSQCNIYMYVT